MAAIAYFNETSLQPAQEYVDASYEGVSEPSYLDHIEQSSVQRFRQRARELLRVVQPQETIETTYYRPSMPEAIVHPPVVARAVVETIDLPTPIRVKALELQRRQQVLVSTANQRLPVECQVMAWSVVPLELFQSDLGRFLMIACDFHAYGPENTFLLPIMPAGAQHLSLPRHPFEISSAQVELARARISALRDRVAIEHKRAQSALQSGDCRQLFSRTDSKTRYCKELSNIVEDVAKYQLQHDAVENHRAHFAALIATL